MSYSVLDLKNDITGMMHGTTPNQVQNPDGVINRAARELLLDVDPQETKRSVQFVGPIFNSVFDYPIAADVKGNKLIDIFPQVQRLPQDVWLQTYNQAFDVWKQNIFSMQDMFTMNFNTGIKTIRINAPWLNAPVVINQIEGISLNGTWSVGGTASNLDVNNMNFAQGAGSLQFDVTSGAATLGNSTMTAVNLSAVENQSSLFVWVYVPTGSSLTSVNLKWGSSATDYWSSTVTQNQQGVSFVNGWNLCQFVWSTASSSGSPDSSETDYALITLNVTATMTGCLVNGLDSVLGTILNYSYYSKYLFRDSSTGAFQETVTDDSNLVNLDTDSCNLLTYKTEELVAQQMQGVDASFDFTFAQNKYQQALLRYKALYKSEVQKPQSQYYYQPQKGYNNIPGFGWGNN